MSAKPAGSPLEPLTPHEARHCAVSYFIAAGCNAKQISVYIGHGDVRQTWNRYGHLMPGDEVTAAAQLDAFLEASARRLAAGGTGDRHDGCEDAMFGNGQPG